MRFTKLLAASAASVLAGLSLAAPALAATTNSSDNTVLIRKVDTSNMPTVTLNVLKPPVSGSGDTVKISENGSPVTNATIKSASDANLPIGVVIVMDTSAASANGGILDQEKAAAVAMIQAKTSNEQFAIIATNSSARTVSPFSSDADALTATINGLQPSNDTALWNGVSLADGLLSGDPSLQANIVVLAASKDSLSPDGAFTNALASANAANAVAFTVGIGNSVDTDNLKQLASNTGGRFISTSVASSTSAILTGLQGNLADQAIVTYTTANKSALDISVSVGTSVATAVASPNTISQGQNVSPTVVPQNHGPSFLNGKIGLLLVAVIALAAVALLLYGIVEVVSREQNHLSSALRPYSDEPEQRDISRIADSEIIKKAVAATAKAAEDRGLLQVIEQRLDQADLPFRPAEALTITVVVALVAMLIGAIFFQIIGIIGAAIIFGGLPLWLTGFMAKRRKKKFTGQLPDTLQLLAGSLRAGYSLVQGLDAVAKQIDAPMGPELTRAMNEARLGRPVEEALQDVSDRMASEDFEWAVMAIKIQREVGGNLAELLMTVSETMIARERLRREVSALTAEGRISAIVLAGLPPIIGVVISLINPQYMTPMFHNVLGQIGLGVGAVMIVIGYWLMMKMIKVEA